MRIPNAHNRPVTTAVSVDSGAVDPVLREWGANIRIQREAHAPDGSLLASDEQPCMTQADLGQLLDPPVAQSTVARWERGQMEPRRHYKAQLARILHAAAQMLFPVKGAA